MIFICAASLFSSLVYADHAWDLRSILDKAEGGDVQAQMELCNVYRDGREVKQDNEDAYFWSTRAVNNSASQNVEMRNKAAVCRDEVMRRLTHEQIAAEQLRVAAETGDKRSQEEFCNMFFNPPHNFLKEASKRWKQAAGLCQSLAEEGNAKAQHHLGVLYEHGWGVRQDHAEALKWLIKSADQIEGFSQMRTKAEQGSPDAQYCLGLYLSGLSQKMDLAGNEEVVRWWRKAAEQGQYQAEWGLGSLLYSGGVRPEDVASDFENAYFWLSLATAQGSPIKFNTNEREMAASKLTSMQRSIVQKRISSWKPTLAQAAPVITDADLESWSRNIAPGCGKKAR